MGLEIPSSWTKYDFVVAADVAIVDHAGQILIVLGVGIRTWGGVLEGHRSGSGVVSRPVSVLATVSGSAGGGVWRLAEAVQIINSATGRSTVQSIWASSASNEGSQG